MVIVMIFDCSTQQFQQNVYVFMCFFLTVCLTVSFIWDFVISQRIDGCGSVGYHHFFSVYFYLVNIYLSAAVFSVPALVLLLPLSFPAIYWLIWTVILGYTLYDDTNNCHIPSVFLSLICQSKGFEFNP